MNTEVGKNGSSASQSAPPKGTPGVDVRSMGEIIKATRNLTADQVEKVLEHQRSTGLRFGEAAIALGMATPDDVLHALAEQFNYAYGTGDRIIQSSELVMLSQPFSAQAESIRAIRAQIQLQTHALGPSGAVAHRALAVISPNVGDGKTYFAANLATSLAQMGERTLIIDADLRGPRMDSLFNVERNIGLSGLLSGRRSEANVIRSVKGVSNLYVLPVGISPPNPLELLEGAAFGMLLAELLTKFKHVIVDTPAATHGADASVIAARCGVALLIARRNASRLAAMNELAGALTAVNTTIAGVVINDY